MLAKGNYPQEYVNWCRTQVDQQLVAYDDLLDAIGLDASDNQTAVGSAVESFTHRFFNHLVIALNAYFVHRTQGQEGKDGNPLNEVRVLCRSLMEHDGTLVADKQIKLDPSTSVLGYHPGEEILLDEEDFTRLSEAFFAEIERKFV